MKVIRSLAFIQFVVLLTFCTEDEIITSLDLVDVSITSPADKQIFTPGENVKFAGVLYGDKLDATDGLRAVWESSVDGVLFEGEVNSDSKSIFETNHLSRNIHTIRLKIYNEVESVIKDSILVYNLIKLETLNRTDHSVTLAWSKVLGNHVSRYKLFRSGNLNDLEEADPIYTTVSANDTTYIDTTAQMGRVNYYQVRVVFDDQISAPSNILPLTPGIYNKLNFPLLKILTDKERKLIYGLVAPEDLDDNLVEGYGIAVMNSEYLQVSRRILTTERFVDISLAPGNDYLYAASRYKIYKIDLATFQNVSSMSVIDPIHTIEVGKNDRLYYQVYPGRYCSCSSRFRIVDLANNTVLNYLGPENYHWGQFVIDPETNTLYHGNELSSPTIVKFSTTNDVFSDYKSASGWSFLTRQIIYRNDKVFWHHILYDSELSRLGSFENNGQEAALMDVSPDGSLAFGWGGLFKVDDQSHIKDIPVPTSGAQFITNQRLIIFETDYDGLKSTIYRYSF